MQAKLIDAIKKVVFSLVLFTAMAHTNAFATGTEGKKIATTSEADSAFLDEYSKKLGIALNEYCDRQLVATVVEWLGTPYRHAGYSKAGIDCSGFVSKIYKDVFDIDLTHSSSAMIYQMKTLVKKSELQQGDILFFRIRGKRISHVGIYLGDNKFVHASSYRGIVVDDLRTPYYQKAYYTAGRPKCN